MNPGAFCGWFGKVQPSLLFRFDASVGSAPGDAGKQPQRRAASSKKTFQLKFPPDRFI
jgi:hypothetical protein